MSVLLQLATAIWKYTPSRALREKYFAAFCWFVRGRKRIVSIDGVTLHLDLGETIDVAVLLRRFEPEIVEAIRTHARPGDIVIDIGANTGVHALAFAARVLPGGKVYAFEPTDHAYARLRENIGLNPALDVEPIQCALADENLPPRQVDFRSSWRTDGVIEHRTSTVEFMRFDDWVRRRGIDHIDVVKLDVDGYEYPVIRGAFSTLERLRPTIFMEVGRYHFDDPERDPIEVLVGIGYRFWDAKSKSEYSHDAMKRRLSEDGMTGITINVIASAADGFVP